MCSFLPQGKAGVIRDSYNCRQFSVCSPDLTQNPVDCFCEDGFVFNSHKEKCVSVLEGSDCARPFLVKTTIVSSSYCERRSELLPHPQSCHMYVHCVPYSRGKSALNEYLCPQNFGFDSIRHICSDKVNCQKSQPVSLHLNSKKEYSEPIMNKDATFGKYPQPHEKYRQEYQPHARSQGEEENFKNQDLGLAQKSYGISGPYLKENPTSPDFQYSMPKPAQSDDSNNVHLSLSTHTDRCLYQGLFPYDCNAYLVCVLRMPGKYTAFLAQCPIGMTFSPLYRRCVNTNLVKECLLPNKNEPFPSQAKDDFNEILHCNPFYLDQEILDPYSAQEAETLRLLSKALRKGYSLHIEGKMYKFEKYGPVDKYKLNQHVSDASSKYYPHVPMLSEPKTRSNDEEEDNFSDISQSQDFELVELSSQSETAKLRVDEKVFDNPMPASTDNSGKPSTGPISSRESSSKIDDSSMEITTRAPVSQGTTTTLPTTENPAEPVSGNIFTAEGESKVISPTTEVTTIPTITEGTTFPPFTESTTESTFAREEDAELFSRIMETTTAPPTTHDTMEPNIGRESSDASESESISILQNKEDTIDSSRVEDITAAPTIESTTESIIARAIDHAYDTRILMSVTESTTVPSITEKIELTSTTEDANILETTTETETTEETSTPSSVDRMIELFGIERSNFFTSKTESDNNPTIAEGTTAPSFIENYTTTESASPPLAIEDPTESISARENSETFPSVSEDTIVSPTNDDTSATEISTDPPTAEVSTDPPTAEVSTDPPTTEVSTDPPTTEVSTDPPTTEVSTDPPTTEDPIITINTKETTTPPPSTTESVNEPIAGRESTNAESFDEVTTEITMIFSTAENETVSAKSTAEKILDEESPQTFSPTKSTIILTSNENSATAINSDRERFKIFHTTTESSTNPVTTENIRDTPTTVSNVLSPITESTTAFDMVESTTKSVSGRESIRILTATSESQGAGDPAADEGTTISPPSTEGTTTDPPSSTEEITNPPSTTEEITNLPSTTEGITDSPLMTDEPTTHFTANSDMVPRDFNSPSEGDEDEFPSIGESWISEFPE